MMDSLARTVTLFLVLTSTGCGMLSGEDGIFRDRGGDYTDAEVVPLLSVPPELDSYTLDQIYAIPESINTTASTFEEIPLPKPIETRRREGVVIQSLLEQSWILIDATPGQVWPLIRDYWTELQISMDYENPGAGLLETSWLEVGSDADKRHKYRIRIEPGLHSGSSEIYIQHLENLRSDPIPLVLNWPEQSSNPDMERDIMRSVSQYLADRNDIYQASSASLLAGSIEAASKANIIDVPEGGQVLELKVGYERAWVQVRQALEAAEIEILDSNRDQSFFSVRFAGIIEDEDAPGFLGRLIGRGGSSGEQEALDFSVRLLETDSAINVIAEVLEAGEGSPGVGSTELSSDLLRVINNNLT